jgi:hypothetical protein
MGSLQQVVEGLEDVRLGAVGVLQVSRPVGMFLEVKAQEMAERFVHRQRLLLAIG